MTGKFTEISTVLQAYFEGLYTCDVAMLEGVFHPQAIYATADETPPLIRTMDEYFAVVAKRVSPASTKAARIDVIDSIEFAGENTALARVRCTISGRDFVDFLTLIRERGEWRIMAKVFQIVTAG